MRTHSNTAYNKYHTIMRSMRFLEFFYLFTNPYSKNILYDDTVINFSKQKIKILSLLSNSL